MNDEREEDDVDLEPAAKPKKAGLEALVGVDKRPIVDLFPMDSFYEHQESVVRKAEKVLLGDKIQVLVIQGPPGFGKSAVSVAIGRKFGAYFCTPQNLLLEQYKKDFPEIKLVMGKSNYICGVTKKVASEAPCVQFHKPVQTDCRLDENGGYRQRRVTCDYSKALDEAERARIALFNYHSFIAHPQRFPKANVLLLDEGHTVRQFIMETSSVSLSKKAMPSLPLVLDDDLDGVIARLVPYKNGGVLKDNYADAVTRRLREVRAEIAMTSPLKHFILRALLKEEEAVNDLDRRIRWLVRLHGTGKLKGRWVVEFNPTRGEVVEEVSLKPIHVDDIVPGRLFFRGRRVVVISATIPDPDTFARTVGIPRERLEYIDVPSTFPKKNRPLKVYPVANMNRKSKDEDFPKLVIGVGRVLDLHPKEKGIIHSHSRDITAGIKKALAWQYPRLIFQKSTESRGEFLARHYNGKKDSVIVAPAMYMGLDLRDDLARFQAMTKIPWPNLGELQIMALKEQDPAWYLQETAVAILQAYGRPVRSKKDYATTYMLDEGWYAFLRAAEKILPAYFLEAIIDMRDDVHYFLAGEKRKKNRDDEEELDEFSLQRLIRGNS